MAGTPVMGRSWDGAAPDEGAGWVAGTSSRKGAGAVVAHGLGIDNAAEQAARAVLGAREGFAVAADLDAPLAVVARWRAVAIVVRTVAVVLAGTVRVVAGRRRVVGLGQAGSDGARKGQGGEDQLHAATSKQARKSCAMARARWLVACFAAGSISP